jgi:DnaJ-class molecular chaperone
MDISKACEILEIEISKSFTLAQVKKAYYKASLKHHPDHNIGDLESNARFQKINEAYTFLSSYIQIKQEHSEEHMQEQEQEQEQEQQQNNNIDDDIIIKFIKTLIDFNIKELSLTAFEGLNKDNSLKIFEYIEKYSSMLGLDDEFIESVRTLTREKMKNDIVIIINPTIENIMNNELYKLEYNNENYYVPLWHDEISYDISETEYLIVKCKPELPENIFIDHNNDVHIKILIESIEQLLNEPYINVAIGGKVFEIPVCELKIKKSQIYTFFNKGISLINLNDIYNTTRNGNIIVYITMNK